MLRLVSQLNAQNRQSEVKSIMRFSSSSGCVQVEDSVAVESLFRIVLNGTEFAVASILPGMEREFTYGFLFAAGAIGEAQDIADFSFDIERGVAFVHTSKDTPPSSIPSAPYILSTACGSEPQTLSTAGLKPLQDDLYVRLETIMDAVKHIERDSLLFRSTGGVHSAALFTTKGELIHRADDIGRHNAFDKVAGACMLNKTENLCESFIVSTGRLSAEIVSKCWRLAIPILASSSCVTTRAIEIAGAANITLAGFVRANRLNVYTVCERIAGCGEK